MATYAEIYNLFADASLRNKIRVAVVVAAENIRGEDPGTANHANRLVWAKFAFSNPDTAADGMMKLLLSQNKDLTVAQITGATDEAIQSSVNSGVDVFADGN